MSKSISNVEKIFVFNFLKNNVVNLEIRMNDKSTNCRIKDFNNDEIKIELDESYEEFFNYRPDIQIFFYFQNTHHVFNTQILKIQKKVAIIRNPQSIVKNLQRKHERVNVNGKLNLDLYLEGELIELDYPKSKLYYYAETPPVNADFSNVKIQDILSRFKNKLSKSVSSNKIQMLRNYMPKSFLEEIVVYHGKIGFIPRTHSELHIKDSYSNLDILKKSDWVNYEIEKNETNPTGINKAISDYMSAYKNNNIHSIAIIPVLYRNYVVALIFIANDHKKSEPISEAVLNYAFQFSRILSYALKVSGYFKAEEGDKDHHKIPLLDLTPGGCGFISQNPVFEEKLLLDHNVLTKLTIKGREMSINSKVVRKSKNLLKTSYGLMFLDIKSEDYDFIDKLLYGKRDV